MVKNIHGGKGHKRNKRDVSRPKEVFKEDGQMYALVSSMLGDHRMTVNCEDGIERIGVIRGSIRKSIWFHKDMYILVTPRDFDDSKVDVIHGYSYEDSKRLGIDSLFAKDEDSGEDVDFISKEDEIDIDNV